MSEHCGTRKLVSSTYFNDIGFETCMVFASRPPNTIFVVMFARVVLVSILKAKEKGKGMVLDIAPLNDAQ